MLVGGLMDGLKIVYAASLLVAGSHLLWQVRALDTERPLLCLKMFRANRDTAALIAAALLLGAVAGL
jgi:4-hydroxybenzoate polyprenyltransferase